ncbi:DNA/RNA non-specific endonuclease [Flavobacterium sp.]|uniref:DNA/RNA non-specific endonuclease n=1 Tax=Flavobacterium sp. TaxID=239 RepID=UPI00286E0CEB|nr:DNA/RNA non-specific endonuclease [Flavobacterium sp.]
MNNFFKIVFFGVTTFVFSGCKDQKTEQIIKSNLLDTSSIKADQFNYLPTSTTRNIIAHHFYTLSYSENHEQAEWVAYELKKEHLSKSNLERPYFIDDPEVDSGSASWKNYKRSGYDKGHLCPAGDRRFSEVAFNETFYTSNISPQLNDFNAGIWNKLEQKTRYWAAKYDGVYVVTGGVLVNNLETIGDENVSVPNYFYKILLDNSRGEYKVIAFLMPHEDSEKPLNKFVVSVDKIEQMTGIDFFPKLPNDIETKIEKIADYKGWSF